MGISRQLEVESKLAGECLHMHAYMHAFMHHTQTDKQSENMPPAHL